MPRNQSVSRVILALTLLVALCLVTALPAHAGQPVSTWFEGVVDTVIASLPWTPTPAAAVTASDSTFPNMDPNGLGDSTNTETFPDMDTNGLEDSTDGEAFPNMDPNG